MQAYELIAMFGRVLLAVTLAGAGLGKLRSRAAFTASAELFLDLGWRSPLARRAASVALPGAELGSAVLLAVPPVTIVGYAVALMLLAAMTVTAAVAVARGRRLRCRCFGLAEEPIGAGTLTRNAVLVAAGLAGLAAALASAGRAGSPAAEVLGAGVGLLGAVVIVRWADLGYLLRGRLAQDHR